MGTRMERTAGNTGNHNSTADLFADRNMLTAQEDILNIEWHIKRKVLLALNRMETQQMAAAALGITARTLYRYIERFYIERCPVTKKYSFKEKR